MDFNVSRLSHSEIHRILLSAVGPRPIAWVSTVNVAGQPNLAPFSFFNCVSVDPPMLAFSPGLRAARQTDAQNSEPLAVAKDTLRNVRETGEFVVSIVTYDLREAMNTTSGEYGPSVNEFEIAKLTPHPSRFVRPPRVGESPVSFECRLHQILDFNPAPSGSSLVVGKVIAIHIDDAHMREGSLDRNSLDLIGRMGGNQYTRTKDRFEMVRPKV
jgi:flavin reductase (DIM6/NTAB) family NADH-FMN oxidoreductase RutF